MKAISDLAIQVVEHLHTEHERLLCELIKDVSEVAYTRLQFQGR